LQAAVCEKYFCIRPLMRWLDECSFQPPNEILGNIGYGADTCQDLFKAEPRKPGPRLKAAGTFV
jgi:hypothetical protein